MSKNAAAEGAFPNAGQPSPLAVICIPAYNEEKTIARVIVQAQKHAAKVIVCDDGSSDMTAAIAEKLGAVVVRHATNMGKGEAMRSLFRAGREMGADMLVTIDGDGQHNPDEIPDLLDLITSGEADVVVGSRFKGGNEIPSHRRVGNKLLNAVTLQGISDTQSGFRAYNRRAVESIIPSERGMGVDSEILMDAARKGLKIIEVPVSVKYGIGKTSTHNPVYHTLDVLLSAVKLTSIRHPLVFYGVPGIALMGIGIYLGLRALFLFSQQQAVTNVVMTYEMAGFTIVLAGLLSLFTALILFTLSTVVRKSN
jgi:glycosyltransferase involved in cell wall biosynthesis